MSSFLKSAACSAALALALAPVSHASRLAPREGAQSTGDVVATPGGECVEPNTARSYATGTEGGNRTLAAGDFNEDGVDDIVVGTREGASVALLLGDGLGGLGEPARLPLAGTPWSLAVGDFDSDGHLDVAAAVFAPGALVLARGDGAGHLALMQTIDSPSCAALRVTAADLDGDGATDIVFESATCGISAYFNEGGGDFRVRALTTVGSASVLLPGDFDGDGDVDLLVGDSSSASVWKNDGDGNFDERSPYVVLGASSDDVAVGDFNGDGRLDVVSSSMRYLEIVLRLGDGQGGFTSYTEFTAGPPARFLRTVDFDRDGKLDVVAIGPLNDGKVHVLRGDGAGHLEPATPFLDFAECPNGAVVARLDPDGAPSIVAADGCAPSVSVLRSKCVTAYFDVCVESPEGERFKAVTKVDPGDPTYGAWQYYDLEGNIPNGKANVVKRTAKSVKLKDGVSEFYTLKANIKFASGKAKIVVRRVRSDDTPRSIVASDYVDDACR